MQLPPHVPLKPRDVTWVEPRIVVEVAFRGWAKEGLLRQASFQRLREDKTVDDIGGRAQRRQRSAARKRSSIRALGNHQATGRGTNTARLRRYCCPNWRSAHCRCCAARRSTGAVFFPETPCRHPGRECPRGGDPREGRRQRGLPLRRQRRGFAGPCADERPGAASVGSRIEDVEHPDRLVFDSIR